MSLLVNTRSSKGANLVNYSQNNNVSDEASSMQVGCIRSRNSLFINFLQFLEMFTCRRILFFMVTTGFILNAFLKTIINITIVNMVRSSNYSDQSETFNWNESQKQNVLGIFFWGFAFTKIPSGRLAEVIGARKVSGYSMLLAGFLNILTPCIARFNYYLLLVSRIMMGFLIGASWPAVMPLASNWIAPTEQSTFMTCIASTALGYALSAIVGGFLISKYGWTSVFYVSGGISIFWSVVWFYLIYDSPQQHPRITLEEKKDIESKMGRRNSPKEKVKVGDIPWKSIITSLPVWAIAIAQISSFFGNVTISSQLPSYVDQIFHYDIQHNGVLSSIPHYGAYVSSIGYGYLADKLLKSNKISTTGIRKIFGSVSLLLPGFCMVLLSLWGHNSKIAITSFFLTNSFNAAFIAGHCANILDICPTFSGTICGIVNMLGAFAVFFSSKLVATLLENDHTFRDWRPLFWVLCAVYFCGGIIYLVLCSGKLQKWDSGQEDKNKATTSEELRPLESSNVA